MTVRELIEQLQALPQEAKILAMVFRQLGGGAIECPAHSEFLSATVFVDEYDPEDPVVFLNIETRDLYDEPLPRLPEFATSPT